MSLFTVLFLCVISLLTSVRSLGNRKYPINPRFRQPVKVNTVPVMKRQSKTQSNRQEIDEDEGIHSRKIVLREITRQMPFSNTNTITSYAGKLGQGSMFVAGNALKLTKSTVKASFDLLAGKHVSLFDIAGTWTMMQEVQLPDGSVHTTPVIFHLAENKTLVSIFNGQEHKSKYTFQERAWPR
jgi:hypothetical protein